MIESCESDLEPFRETVTLFVGLFLRGLCSDLRDYIVAKTLDFAIHSDNRMNTFFFVIK